MAQRNVLLSTGDELTLIYDVDTLTNEEVKNWVERFCGVTVNDIADIRQDDIQYYGIDGRFWMDAAKESTIKKLLEARN